MVKLEQNKKKQSAKSILMLPTMNIMRNQNQWFCTGNLCVKDFQQVLVGSIFASAPPQESYS